MIERKSCLLFDDYAVVTQGRELPKALPSQCNAYGRVDAVHYAVLASDGDRRVSLGDQHSLEEAEEIVRRLQFETGLYSRGWEISSGHLDPEGQRYLEQAAATGALLDFIAVFRIPDGALGVKLISTPWEDANLRHINDTDVAELWQAHLQQGMPVSLANVLHRAGEADVRLLIFDGGAAPLAGLPVFDPD
jgi:hypothetical protein